MIARKNVVMSILLLSFLLITCNVIAQVVSLRVGSQSPTAASLGKYGDIPVSLYTGIPNIDIPLYEIKSRKLSVPISISYHASGVKVEEIPGWVGLGWALNAGGVITRTVRGLPDDDLYGYHNTGDELDDNDYWDNTPPLSYLQDLRSDLADSEPDIYFFNFNGKSGKFIYGPDLTRPISYQKLKITFEPSNHRWIIIDEDGICYTFAANETTNDVAISTTFTGTSVLNYTSSWFLTKIESPYGNDEITFTYSSPQQVYHKSRTYREKYQKISSAGTCLKSDAQVDNEYKTQARYLQSIIFSTGSIDFVRSLRQDALNPDNLNPQEYKLDEIKIKNVEGNLVKKYLFNYGYFNQVGDFGFKRLRLDSLYEETAEGSKSPSYKFDYNTSINIPTRLSNSIDHWGYYNGKNNSDLVPYVYDPNPVFQDVQVPLYIAGADRSPDPSKMQAGILTKIHYPTGGYTEFTYENHDYGWIGSDEVSYELGIGDYENGNVYALEDEIDEYNFSINSYHGACVEITTDIDPPYGDPGAIDPIYGYVEIRTSSGTPVVRYVICGTFSIGLDQGDYKLVVWGGSASECNYASGSMTYREVSYLTTQTIDAGGVRIKKIKTYDGVNSANDIIKEYEYNSFSQPNRSSGSLVTNPIYHYYGAINDPTCGCVEYRYVSRSVFSKNTLGSSQGSHIGYSNVKEIYGENGENGYCQYYFTSPVEYPDETTPSSNTWPFGTHTNNDWKRGKLKKVLFKNTSGELLQKIENEYQLAETNLVKNYRALTVKQEGIDGEEQMGYLHTQPNPWIHTYEVKSRWTYITKETKTNYDLTTGDSTKAIKNYYYENPSHTQLTKAIETNTDGTQRITQMQYPEDYDNTSGSSDPVVQAIESMKTTKHIHNAVLEKWVTEKISGQPDLVVAGELVKYKDFGSGQILPHEIYKLEASSGLSSFSPSYVDGSKVFQEDSNYDMKEAALDYDDYGNLKKMKDGKDVQTVYKWGYDDALLIAEVGNSDYKETSFLGFENEEIHDGWSTGSSSVSTEIAHTGDYSFKANAGQWSLSNLWYPESSGHTLEYKSDSEYIASVWVYLTNPADVRRNIFEVKQWNPEALHHFAQATKLGEWELLTIEFDASQMASGSQMCVWASAYSANSYIYFDDLRVYPKDALMTTQTYDKNTYQLTSQSDENNIAINYGYDPFGRLSQTLDHEKNILTENSYYYSRDGNGDDYNENDPNGIAVVTFPNGLSTEGRVGYWRLEGNAIDGSESGNDGTINGAADDPGYIGRCLKFDGSNDYVDMGTSSSLDIDNAITVIAWVNHISGNGHIVNRGGGWSDNGYSLFWYNGKIRVELQKSGEKAILDNTIPGSNEWHHIAFTWDIDSKTIRTYIDGVQATNTSQFNGPIGSPTQHLNIGRNQLHSNYFYGWIDEVKLYNHALSADEILADYQSMITTTYYDGLGREIQTQSHHGSNDIVTKTEYNNMGQVSKQFKPQELSNPDHDFISSVTGDYEEYTYYTDPLQRLKLLIHPNNSTVSYDYGIESFSGANHRFEKLTDEENKVSKSYFDVFENAVGQKSAVNTTDEITVRQSYNVLGNVTTITPPKGANYVSTFDYNTLGQLQERDTPDEQTSKQIYDSNGNLRFSQSQVQNNSGDDLTFYQYDEFNRVTLVGNASADATIPTWSSLDGDVIYDGGTENFEDVNAHPENLRARYYYDEDYAASGENYCRGRLTKVEVNDDADADPEQVTTYVYDAHGNVIEERITLDNLSEKTIMREYDLLGREIQVTYPSGNTIVKQYDAMGRLQKIYSIN